MAGYEPKAVFIDVTGFGGVLTVEIDLNSTSGEPDHLTRKSSEPDIYEWELRSWQRVKLGFISKEFYVLHVNSRYSLVMVGSEGEFSERRNLVRMNVRSETN